MNPDNRRCRWNQFSIRAIGLLALVFAACITFERVSENTSNSNSAKLEKEIAALNVKLAHLYALKQSLPGIASMEQSKPFESTPALARLMVAKVHNLNRMIAHSHKSLELAMSELASISNSPSE